MLDTFEEVHKENEYFSSYCRYLRAILEISNRQQWTERIISTAVRRKWWMKN